MTTIKWTVGLVLSSFFAFLIGCRYQPKVAATEWRSIARVLTAAAERGTRFQWGVTDVLKDVRIQGPVSNWDELAAALNQLGTLESLSVDHGSPAEVDRFLSRVVAHHVQMLAILDVGASDDGIAALANFPSVKQMQIVPSAASGESFPVLHKLESLDLSYAPVSDAGLLKILSCPKLHSIWLKETEISAAGLLEALEKRQSALQKLMITGCRIEEEGIADAKAKAKLIAPNVELFLTAGDDR